MGCSLSVVMFWFIIYVRATRILDRVIAFVGCCKVANVIDFVQGSIDLHIIMFRFLVFICVGVLFTVLFTYILTFSSLTFSFNMCDLFMYITQKAANKK